MNRFDSRRSSWFRYAAVERARLDQLDALGRRGAGREIAAERRRDDGVRRRPCRSDLRARTELIGPADDDVPRQRVRAEQLEVRAGRESPVRQNCASGLSTWLPAVPDRIGALQVSYDALLHVDAAG